MGLSLTEKANTGILSEDCDNMNGNIFIAGKHSISLEEYNEMIFAFFGTIPHTLEQRVFTPADFQKSCIANCVRFEFNPFLANNSDINVAIAPHGPIQTGYSVTGKYSLHLFRALQNLHQPDEYLFCKARTLYQGQIVVTLALAVVSNGVIVYYGDLTNMYP